MLFNENYLEVEKLEVIFANKLNSQTNTILGFGKAIRGLVRLLGRGTGSPRNHTAGRRKVAGCRKAAEVAEDYTRDSLVEKSHFGLFKTS